MTGGRRDRARRQPTHPGALLFTPLALRGVTLRNRIVVSPMCQYASVDGAPVDWHLAHLGRYAIGGAGLVFYEETAVEARGRKTHACAGIYRDDHVPAYRRVARMIRDIGATAGIQLGHSGRKASVKSAMQDWAPLTEADAREGQPPWQGVAPSALPAGPGKHVPREMDRDDIRAVIDAFRAATRRALEAEFEVLEIHGAHGYLLHQFLSPISNRRTDAYGGDREARMRFPLEVAEAVRAAWPAELPLFYRVSAIDGAGGAWSLNDSVAFARALAERGVDVVDCSSGGITGDTDMRAAPAAPGGQVPFAERLRREAGVMTMAVGFITEPGQAEAILREGRADLVGMARELMYHADWPVHAAHALGVPDHLRLFPPPYAHRLLRREEILRGQRDED